MRENKPLDQHHITLTEEVNKKLELYVDLVDTEISGWGKADFDQEKGEWRVTDIKIFKQTVHGTETALDGDTIGQFTTELVKAKEDPSKWCVWWHSHVNMAVFWSGQDMQTIMNQSNQDVLVSIVTNKRREFKGRIDVFKNKVINTAHGDIAVTKSYPFIDDVDVFIETSEADEELKQTIAAEIKEKVTKSATYGYDIGKYNTHRQDTLGLAAGHQSNDPYEDSYGYNKPYRFDMDNDNDNAPAYADTLKSDYEEYKAEVQVAAQLASTGYADEDPEDIFIPANIRSLVRKDYYAKYKDQNKLSENDKIEARALSHSPWDEIMADLTEKRNDITIEMWTSVTELSDLIIEVKILRYALYLKATEELNSNTQLSAEEKRIRQEYLRNYQLNNAHA